MSKYYAVRKGLKIGIFNTWSETEKLVKGFKGAQYKSFKNKTDAENYIRGTTIVSSNPNKINIKPVCGLRVRAHGIGMIELIATHAVFYTDGSCVNKIGGYGYVNLTMNGHVPVSGKVPYYPTTNQVSELYAILQAINYANIHHPRMPVLIYTDSKYSIGCLTQWCWNWMKNGWVNSKGKPVENQELIKLILEVMKHIKVKFTHVKAHNGDKYNEIADKLANEGRFK